MYLALEKGDHIRIDEDNEDLVHVVADHTIALTSAKTGEKLSHSFYTACLPGHRRSLAGWDYDAPLYEVTSAPVTCLGCLAQGRTS